MTLQDALALTKFTISSLSTLSAAAGYVAARRGPDWGLVPLVAGTLFLALAASTWNELLERDLDATMVRTRLRPLPRGAVSVAAAGVLSATLGLAGTGLLAWRCGWPCALLGLAALGWYGLVYTPLKRVAAFAVLPGALIGALPPAMGWAAAGGSLAHPALAAIALVFLLWQIPHFWILALLHQDDYRRAGLPTLTRHLTPAAVQRLTFAWICATAAASSLLPAFGAQTRPGAIVLQAAAAMFLVLRATRLLRGGLRPATLRRTFADLNGFLLVLMAALVLGQAPR